MWTLFTLKPAPIQIMALRIEIIEGAMIMLIHQQITVSLTIPTTVDFMTTTILKRNVCVVVAAEVKGLVIIINNANIHVLFHIRSDSIS